MTISTLRPPTSRLPPIGKIKLSSTANLLDAISYLRTLYNPEISGSRVIARKPCPLTPDNQPDSPILSRRFHPSNSIAEETSPTALQADTFETEYTIRWLTALVSQSAFLDEASEEWETIVREAASLLAICAGAASAGARSRLFKFSRKGDAKTSADIKVQLVELPLDNHDYASVGAQTWGGACLMADMIVQSPACFGLRLPWTQPLRVLELGSGTGLVALAAGKVLEEQANHLSEGPCAEIIASDFHPVILENLARNIDTNFHSHTSSSLMSISAQFLDWCCLPDPPTPPFDSPVDVIFGADIVYEPDHARWIKSCVEVYLRKPPCRPDILGVPQDSSYNHTVPTFHLVIPLRSTHTAESRSIEAVFPFAPTAETEMASPGIFSLAITAKEIILCEDTVRSGSGAGGHDVAKYIYYTICWI